MMDQHQALGMICRALRDRGVVDFVRRSVMTGYLELCPGEGERIVQLVNTAFNRLSHSQVSKVDLDKLLGVSIELVEDVFKKKDSDFWFNRAYHHYKTRTKPDADFEQLEGLIEGNRILDFGSGSGYLATRFSRGGYQVHTADVLDYRYQEARQLPFVRLERLQAIPLASDCIDTALVQAVLHHIEDYELSFILGELGRIAPKLLIKEDTYCLPDQQIEVVERCRRQPLLQSFMRMPEQTQFLVLALIDYYANAIAQGILEMNMPLNFKTMTEWESTFASHGWRVSQTIIAGFEPGRVHKSCHVWFICELSEDDDDEMNG
jgi:hypothetical protein